MSARRCVVCARPFEPVEGHHYVCDPCLANPKYAEAKADFLKDHPGLAAWMPSDPKPTTPPARPVRGGEVVVHITTGHRGATDRVTLRAPNAWLRTTGVQGFEDWIDRWTHHDGAPIDVEATLAELRGDVGKLARLQEWQEREHVEVGKLYEDFVVGTASKLVDAAKDADLDAARKRIAELEDHLKDSIEDRIAAWKRASHLGDEAGALRTELTQVKAELCDALRKLERAERKAKR